MSGLWQLLSQLGGALLAFGVFLVCRPRPARRTAFFLVQQTDARGLAL
jgi:hypothetical protein